MKSKTDIKALRIRRITDATAFLMATKANRNSMKLAIADYNMGKGIAIKTENIWK